MRTRTMLGAAALAAALWAAPAEAGLPQKGISKSDPVTDTASIVTVPGCDFLDPAVCLLPWPNDYFTKEAGTETGRRVALQLQAMPRSIYGKPIDPTDINRQDGFSPGSPIVTKVPGLDNKAAFDASGIVPETDIAQYARTDQPVLLIDAEDHTRAMIWAELDVNPASDADRVLIIRPAKNLTEGRRYIVALRNLKDASGAPIPAQRPFQVYRDAVATLNPLVEERRAHMEELFTDLALAGVERSELYLAWDFTVASEKDRTGRAATIRDHAFAGLGDTDLANRAVEGDAPSFTVDTVQHNSHDNIARRVTGTFKVPCYLDKPNCVPGSKFLWPTPDSTEPAYIPGNTMTAKYTCIVPKSAVAPGAPAARISLYGHGLLGSQSEITAGNVRKFANEHNIIFCATDWYGMATEDLPSVAAILLDVSNFPLLADRVQQGLLAQMFLGRLAIHEQGFPAHEAFRDAEGTVVDTRRLFYDGNSQGGIIGGALMALTPDADRGVLGVPGMNYAILLNRSVDFEADPARPCPPDPANPPALPTDPEDLTDPEHLLEATGFAYACPLYAIYPNQLERQLLFSLMQQMWDRAEANGYANHMTTDPIDNTPPHEVLLHVALGDHQVAQTAAEIEARTIGAVVRADSVDPGRSFDVTPQYGIAEWDLLPYAGSVYELWDSGPIRDGGTRGTDVPPAANIPPRAGRDPHSDPRATLAARKQKSDFLQLDGRATDQCNAGPCYSRYWKTAQE